MYLLSAALAGTVELPPAVLGGAPIGAAHPADAALVVANEDYAFLPDVPFAGHDGDAMADVLVSTRGIAPDRVRVLHGANREQVLEAFDAAAALVTDGTLWVYWSGHGAGSPTSAEPLLVGDDAKREATVFTARSVSVEELRARAGGRDLVVVVDACFTGVGRSGEVLVPGARFVVPAWATAAPAHQLVVTGAGPDQVAGSYPAAEHGLFTWLFAGGIRGWADGAHDGVRDGTVTGTELDTWITRSLAILQVHDQAPVWHGALDRVLVAGDALERPPDLRLLPRPGAAPSPVMGPAPAPELLVKRLPGTWVLGDTPTTSLEVRSLAAKDPEGAVAVRRARMVPWGIGTAAAIGIEGLLVGAVMVPISFSSDFAETPQEERFYRNFGLGGLAVAGAMGGWEVWLASRLRHHRADLAEAATRTLANGG